MKIDQRLLAPRVFSVNEKQACFVSANDYSRLKKILISKDIEIINEYLFIKSFFIKATREQLLYLSKLASVRYISINASALALTNVARNVLARPQSILNGEGVGVAFIDTGLFRHSDFLIGQNRIKKFVDFVGEKTYAYDDNGHGTFVAGVCAGNGALSGGKYMGFAPKANIYSLKALDSKGEAFSNKILNAMQWVYENHKKYKIKVVCMSFGSEPLGLNDPIMNGAEELWKSGIIVVAAAGNSGPEFQSIKSPGVSKRLITVGGMDDNRLDDNNFSSTFFEIADFSSRGPSFKSFKPDLVAPAVDIISCKNGGGYTKLSGTSVATPMIAGAMCLLCEKNPNITPDEAKRKLLSVCKPISYNRNLEGFGYPNLTKLLN